MAAVQAACPCAAMIYLDHNATTPLRPAVLAAMQRFLSSEFGNPSSVHRLGAAARAAVEDARAVIARALGAEPAEIVFTSGGTEANNLALFGLVGSPGEAHLVISPIEHSSVIEPARCLERRGARVTWLPVDAEGRVSIGDLEAALCSDTRLVSVGWANNEIGTIQDIRSLSELCRRRGVLFHVDAVQALGKVPVSVEGIDSCSFSAHKIGGPKGAGALYLRRGLELQPLILGGGQERGRRAGTESTAAVVGFGAAAADLWVPGERLQSLRERLWNGLRQAGRVHRNSPVTGSLPNTLNISFDGVTGEVLVAALDLEGVAVSVGSACAAGAAEPSHVLRAVGYSEREARDGVRFSIGCDTSEAEVDRTVEIVARVLHRIAGVGRGSSGERARLARSSLLGLSRGRGR